MRKLHAFIVGAAVVFSATACASIAPSTTSTAPDITVAPAAKATSAAATSAANKPAETGDTITIDGAQEGHRLSITVVKVVDPAISSDEFSTPADGSRYVAVQFRIHNVGSGTYSDDPAVDVAGIDASGQQYEPAFVSSITAGAELDSNVTVAPGDSVLGFEVFEIPKGEKLAEVQYKLNMGLFGDSAQWNVG